MSSDQVTLAERPLFHVSKRFFVLLALLLLGVGWFAFAWVYQLRHGLVVTGMRDSPAGAPWGIYTVNFIFFIGIAHAGIAVAAAIRLLELRDHVPVGRLAELLTIFGLLMAGLSLVFDIGRPDRMFEMIIHYPARLGTSPLIWDLTAVFTYLIVSSTYLYIELREDLAKVADRVRWRRLYKLLLLGHRPGERKRMDRVIWWASLFIIPIMVMVHSTVAWVFGLMVARPGWYSAILAPYFLTGAVLSGLAAIVLLAALYRWLFGWQTLIKPVVFRDLGKALCWLSLIYIYFHLSEIITVRYAGPTAELSVNVELTEGRMAWLFWAHAAALLIAAATFLLNTVFPKLFRIATTVIASALVVVALWVTRYLLVISAQTHSHMSAEHGSYAATWVEWSLVGGTFVLLVLLCAVFTKFFPVVSLTELENAAKGES